jgi:hypothetical protein
MKVKHQLKLLYFQVDKGLMCMDIVSTFHIIVIIYQSLNVKYFGKFEQLANFKHTFYPLFLYRFSSNFSVQLTINSMKCWVIAP